jgi:hypothetical protein
MSTPRERYVLAHVRGAAGRCTALRCPLRHNRPALPGGADV